MSAGSQLNKLTMISKIIGIVLWVISFALNYVVLPKVISGYTAERINLWWMIAFIAITYLFLGWDVLLGAAKNIMHGKIFDEKFLMSIATITAFVIGSYIEACSVMLFYSVGEIIQDRVVGKSKKSITSLIDIRANIARQLIDGREIEVDPMSLIVGDTIIIKTGDKVPVDSVVTSGAASLDTSALTGESKYQEVKIHDKVLSGSVNKSGTIFATVEKIYNDSMVNKILDLVQNASANKSRSEQFVTRFAKYYTPIVCGLSILIVITSLIFRWTGVTDTTLKEAVYPGLIFLVVSCPCALVLSVPLAYLAAIGNASKHGILIKGSNYLEQLDKAKEIVFDKTGTITKGNFAIKRIVSLAPEFDEDKLLKIAAYCEIASNHPIANALVSAYGKDKIDINNISDREVSKSGASVLIDGVKYGAGNLRYLKSQHVKSTEVQSNGLVVYVFTDTTYIGYIVLEDEVRHEISDTILKLKNMGVGVALLTGDSKEIAKAVCNGVGIEKYYAELNPIEKVNKLKKLHRQLPPKGTQVYVGDGVNDSPVLAIADVGIAMGGYGSDAAIESSDIVLMNDEITKLPDVIKLAKQTKKIVLENIIFALSVKFIVLFIALFPVNFPLLWGAVFADVGVSIIAIINSMRARFPKKEVR